MGYVSRKSPRSFIQDLGRPYRMKVRLKDAVQQKKERKTNLAAIDLRA